MNIFKSIEHRIKAYYLWNFEKTKYGKALLTLKDKYEGKRCFIIGNGPSLTIDDLNKLKHEYTFAFNRIYLLFNKTEWRPTFYCTQDEKIIAKSYDDIISLIKTPYIFAPINIKWYNKINLKTKYYFSPLSPVSDDICPEFCEDVVKHVGVGNTVAYTAMQLAVYMGFKKIYLLGVDHNFAVYQDKDGNIIKDENVKDYFCQDYNKDKDDLFIPRLDVSTMSYIAAQKYIQNHPVKIFNATRGGKLEVYPRIDFDSIFK